MAVGESDLRLLVVAGRESLEAADEAVRERLRRTGKPAVLVVNKGDTREAQSRFPEFYRLGIERQLLLSAEHGTGVEELRDLLAELLPERPETPRAEAPAVAIVGRPDGRKSSLLNLIAGQNRATGSSLAGA